MGERNVSIGAIVLGYFTFAGVVVLLNAIVGMLLLSVDPFPISFFIAALAAVLGVYVAGVSARRDETRHGLILAAVLALTAAASLLAGPRPKAWSIWGGFVIIALGAGLGGFLRERQHSGQSTRAAPP